MEIYQYSIGQLKKLINQRKVSPEELYEIFLKRIKKYNPKLNAFLTVIDKPKIDYKKRGLPLFGIPFSMKDVYVTKGVRTTASSKVLENYIPQYDATVYKKLKNAGAILIGKTNCDAWGHGSSTENSDFGPTRNPWNLKYVPGGSSGGSAAGLAANLSVFDIGEDTGGSIRLPAAFCSIVGLKVTYGLVSRYGAIAYASSLDTVGPMTRTVKDCAIVLEAIAGIKKPVTYWTSVKVPKYSQLLNKNVGALKIGIPKEYFTEGIDKEVAKQIEQAIKIFKKMGMKMVEISLPMTKYAVATYYLIATSETSSNLARYDGIRYGKARNKFGPEAKRRIILGTFTLSAGYYDAYYLKATKVRTLIKNDFNEAFKKVDVILAPTSPTPPFKIGEKIDDPLKMYLSDILTIPVNLAGLPALSIPCGLSKDKLPIGMQLIGKHFDEAKILNIGYKFEKQIGGFPIIKN